jgi:hypothetical protein
MLSAVTIQPRLPISVVFTTGFDPYQLLIKLGTGCSASHAAIGIGDQLLHAYEDGVVLEPRTRWFGKEMDQKLVAEFLVLQDVGAGVREALQHIGKPYDVFGAFKIGILMALKAMGSPIDRFGGEVPNDAHTCACFTMLLDPGGVVIPEWRGIDRGTVVPRDLLEAAVGGASFLRVA